jgi:hypothetical protein
MKTRRIQVSAKKADELVSLLRGASVAPINTHLSDDEFVAYTTEMTTPEEMRHIDEHLASCPECLEEMERLLTGARGWRGERGKQRLAALRERREKQWTVSATAPSRSLPSSDERRVIELRHVKARWQALVTQEPDRLAAANDEDGREILAWESSDEVLSGHVVLENNGDLTFRFSAKGLSQIGKHVILRLGSFQHEEPLQQVSKTRVGAEIVIPWQRRPVDLQDLDIEIVEERSRG